MSKEPMKQIDLIEELEKANQETITINKEDLETLIDALDASYKIFEASEEAELEFIKDDWRRSAYQDLRVALNSNNMDFAFIIQAPYKDTIKIKNSEDVLIIDMYYDGDGFYSTVSASYYDEPKIWEQFQTILKLKS